MESISRLMPRGENIATYELLRRKRDAGIEVLFERYGRKLYSYAVTSWRLDEDESWNLVYETLYKALENIDRYDFASERKFGSFLFTIFCNNLRRQYRDARKREERLSFTHFNETLFEASRANGELSTERKVQERLTQASVNEYHREEGGENALMTLLEDCLEQLQDWERMLLLLRSQDMPYNDIAKYISRPADQLKVYYARARKKLEKMMDEKMKGTKQALQ